MRGTGAARRYDDWVLARSLAGRAEALRHLAGMLEGAGPRWGKARRHHDWLVGEIRREADRCERDLASARLPDGG